MKVKELLKTVNVAWSPAAQYPILLAAGTAAQQLDASFNTSASLDLYSLNLQQPGYDLELKATVASDHRFHKVIWGSYGKNPSGIIVGGCDYGTIKIYSAEKLLENNSNCLISSPDRHSGPVRAMDFNPFQSNLLATGAGESEIYIWDINNIGTPMTPGAPSQPAEDVQYIAWNKQVQHILASTFSQRCVIWDLRKNEAIIKLTDANSKVRWKSVQWHPDVATQLCLASEDDQNPIIELWDLRFATSPLKTLQSHQRGVLSIAWNPHDSDLLLSCAKDNRILCWNPNSDAPNGEVISEFAHTSQWNFDVSWCPRHPGLLVGTSFDGHAVVYSLLGGHNQASSETSNKIVDSFPGMDPFTQQPPVAQAETTAILQKAPKWLKRPFGASFGFGGKLLIFENNPVDPSLPPNSNRKVYVSQVITNPELIQRSNNLEAALANGQYGDFCKDKVNSASNEHNKKVWRCMSSYFGSNMSKDVLELLGYNVDEMNNKLNKFVPQQEINTITDGISKMNNALNGNSIDGSAAFDAIAEQEQNKKPSPVKVSNKNFRISTGDDEAGLISQAILLGNIEAAVSLCFANKRYADAVILSMAGGPELLAQTQYRYFSEHSGALNSLINSLVSENWAEIVQNSDIHCWKEVLVGIFTNTTGEERSSLCDMLGDRLATCENANLRKQAQICYICSGNVNKLIESSDATIQETVELVMIMQKAVEFHGSKEFQIEGNIATVLTQYAEMLASEGDLDAALQYLGNSQEERISMLRDRLYMALGHIKMDPHRGSARTSVNQNYYDQTRRSVTGQNTFNQMQPQSTVPSWNTAPTKSAFGGISNQFNPVMQPAPQSVPTHDQYAGQYQYGHVPASQPAPPPPSVAPSNLSSSRPPSVGPQSRSKYILDPSVQSSATYGSMVRYTQPYISQQPMSNSGYAAQNTYQPHSPGSYGGYPNMAQSTMYNPEPEILKPAPANILSPNPVPLSPYDASTHQPQQQQQSPPQQRQPYGNENAYQPPPHNPGWNDPPINMSSKAQAKIEKDYQSPEPIVHPLLGAAPPDPNMYQQDHGYHQQSYHQDPQAPYNQFNQYGQPQNVPLQGSQYARPMEPIQPTQQMHQQVHQPAHPAPQRIPEVEKPKAPIPEEHMHLRTVLEELKTQCYESAKNPQIKRKLEDVSRKLEVLYDGLRENKLSPNTLEGLHRISNMIQCGDYSGGLATHTELVSGPDFSQIASFMPGIKVLLSSALQLGVFIR